MKFKKIIDSMYMNRERKKKMNEKLEIGKIKFEVIPVYINKVCVHSIFQLKYSQVIPTQVNKNSIQYIVVKVLVVIILSSLLYSTLYNMLVTIGIITLVNEAFTIAITPYIFNDMPTSNIPQLTILLQKVNLLNP
tara:strand:+ start:555 stop:959 length:405 start_codon:yes stop_codon:yes gene_type:complete